MRGRAKYAFWQDDSGSAIVELGMVILPLFALLLLTLDVAWAIFAKASLQFAVHEGVRFAVTGQVLPGYSGLNSSIQQVVHQNSLGFVQASQVTVAYYSPSTLTPVTGAASTAGGNVVQVSVSGITVRSFGPIWRSITVLSLGAQSSDVMESPPGGIAPIP